MAKKILVVDDEEPIRKMNLDLLSNSGYEVYEAESGKDALARIIDAESRPNLVITDVNMPGMSGLELSKKIRDKYPGVKIIALSGLVHREECDSYVDAYFSKPYDLAALRDKARELLGE